MLFRSKRWLGDGPYRVWKNRLGGGTLGGYSQSIVVDEAFVLRVWELEHPMMRGEGDFVDVLSAGAYTTTYSSVGFNGFPPLNRGMSRRDWAAAFAAAYADFCRRVDDDEETLLDPYAAESPGEFFAVLSEAFFEMPQALAGDYPAVYGQLVKFYRQDPLWGMNAPGARPIG